MKAILKRWVIWTGVVLVFGLSACGGGGSGGDGGAAVSAVAAAAGGSGAGAAGASEAATGRGAGGGGDPAGGGDVTPVHGGGGGGGGSGVGGGGSGSGGGGGGGGVGGGGGSGGGGGVGGGGGGGGSGGNNNAPVANAGPDQTSNVLVGDAVILDGSASSDADGHALTYTWSLVAVPEDSTAELSDPTVVNPEFVADKPGMYTARLVVHDGITASAPDDVSVTAVVPPPVVDITAPENLTVVTASPVAVTGTVDDPSATITVNGTSIVNNNGSYTANVALQEGSNTVTVVARNGTGDGSASIDVILNTTDNPALKVTSPGSDFIVGEEFAVGALFPASTQVAVAGVIKVNTRALLPALNRPTVTVNGVPADVSLQLFFSECGLLNPFQCWRFTATIPLDQGTARPIRAVGTDVQNRSTTVSIGGTVDYCRVGVWSGDDPTDIGKDPGVLALAGPAAGVQGNRCHEIDGCSAPVVGEFANDPLPLAICNVASTEFGAGTIPPSEHFVHGLKSQFNRPCNNHDVCYQTCVNVTGLSETEREERWRAAWHACNAQQYEATLNVCRQAYPGLCSGACFPLACGVYLDEKKRCFNRAAAYLVGVETSAGFDRFKERQAHYCAS